MGISIRWLGLLAAPLVAACTNPPSDPAADGGADAPVLPPCSPTSPCADNAATCCDSHCTYLDHDPNNCGACGVACASGQFCNGQACFDAVVSNLCQNPSAAAILDGLSADDQGTSALGDAIGKGCAPTVAVREIVQGASGSIDGQGRPTLGPGDTYVAAGGGFGQQAVAYLSSTLDAPVYATSDSTSFSFVRSSDSGVVVHAQTATLTTHHDYFVSYTAVEPQSGTLVFTVYGFYAPGTAAGVFWFDNQVMPDIASYSKTYYVYEWTDKNGDGLPDANDTFTLVGSG